MLPPYSDQWTRYRAGALHIWTQQRTCYIKPSEVSMFCEWKLDFKTDQTVSRYMCYTPSITVIFRLNYILVWDLVCIPFCSFEYIYSLEPSISLTYVLSGNFKTCHFMYWGGSHVSVGILPLYLQFSVAITVSIHFCVICCHLHCPMVLFEFHVTCWNLPQQGLSCCLSAHKETNHIRGKRPYKGKETF